MPQVHFGRKDEPSFTLHNSDDLLAVRTRTGRSLRAGPVPPAAAGALSDGQLVLAFPEAGVEVYRVEAQKKSVEQRKGTLRREPDVRFAGRVLVDESGEPVVYTENLFVKFKDDEDPEECKRILEGMGLTIKEQLSYATNAFFVGAPEGTGQQVFTIADQLLKRADMEYAHPELVKRRAHKAIAPEQWHLRTTVVAGRTVTAHAHVEAAHRLTRGEGVTIAVIDDGIDIEHPEFRSAGKIVAPRDATFPLSHAQGKNPRPKDSDPRFPEDHGTACAGVACADGVDGASGVAPAARLMPIRLAAGLGSQSEANAFRWAADNGADVISCSWGPPDGAWWDPSDALHRQRTPLPASTKLAIDYAARQGRAGKGCVILFAAGNGNESVENDGYASYEKVIAVAACNDRGARSVYSDYGAAVWCAFPSSDSEWAEQGHPAPLTRGIWTTDRMSRLGYNPGVASDGDTAGNYTNDFGGTSSACPGAAGVAALMLAVNPELTASALKERLAKACERIDPAGGDYDARGHSALYGFGRLNAERAVQLAHDEARDVVQVSKVFNRRITDLQTIEAELDVAETQPLRSLAVNVDIQHTWIGDLVITLTPPAASGIPSIKLHDRTGGSTHDLRRSFDASTTPALAQAAGRNASGRWLLRVQDTAREDEGQLIKFGLELRLGPAPVRALGEPPGGAQLNVAAHP